VKKGKKAPRVQRRHVGRPTAVVQNEACLLIAIRVVVAPLPVIPLVAMIPMVVSDVPLVASVEIAPVGAVFAVIPVVVVVVMRVVDANLNSGILCRRCGHDGAAEREGSRQEQPT